MRKYVALVAYIREAWDQILNRGLTREQAATRFHPWQRRPITSAPAVLPAVVLASIAILTACSTGGTTTSATPPPGTSSPSASGQDTTASPSPGRSAVAQTLAFTGPVAGMLSSAATTCGIVGSARQFNAVIEGTMNGQKLNLSITVLKDFKGAGNYTVGSITDGGASLTMTFGQYTGATSFGAGTMTVNADGKSGTLDAGLNDAERVRGGWACDKLPGP